MRLRPSATCAVLALGALLPTAAAAQSPDAFVLPFGMFRLGVEAQHATYDSRFDAAGSRVPLTRGLDGELRRITTVSVPLLAQGKRFVGVLEDPAILGALLALALTIAAGELALRAAGFSAPIWYQPDTRLGWAMRPGAQGWFTKEGRAFAAVNPAGFRARPHVLDKPAGAYRIAVLGDSVVEAFQVGLKAAFWWQLQENLRTCPALRGREVETLAFGVSGYGTAQQALLLESTAMRYRPDLVLVAFAPNDVRNNSPALVIAAWPGALSATVPAGTTSMWPLRMSERPASVRGRWVPTTLTALA